MSLQIKYPNASSAAYAVKRVLVERAAFSPWWFLRIHPEGERIIRLKTQVVMYSNCILAQILVVGIQKNCYVRPILNNFAQDYVKEIPLCFSLIS
jgi:hypothetical protein